MRGSKNWFRSKVCAITSSSATGLVVGLKGTGDRQQTLFPAQSLANLLQQMGVTSNPALVRGEKYSRRDGHGHASPVRAARYAHRCYRGCHGRCANLQGGLLLMTSMKGVDGQVYAVSQGSVVTGGFVAGRSGNSQTVNHPTVGRVPGGATDRARRAHRLSHRPRETSTSLQPDFTTALRISTASTKSSANGRPPLAQPGEFRAGGGHDSAGVCHPSGGVHLRIWKRWKFKPTGQPAS